MTTIVVNAWLYYGLWLLLILIVVAVIVCFLWLRKAAGDFRITW